MDKATFKKNTLEVIEDMHKRYVEMANKVIDNMDEETVAEYEKPYFAPKAFYEALVKFNADKITTQSYGLQFVRKHKKAVRQFLHEILYKRF